MRIRYFLLPAMIAVLFATYACAPSQTASRPHSVSVQNAPSPTSSQNRAGYDEQIVQTSVSARQGQLIKIYQQESSIIMQAGSLKITLYVLENGDVAQVDMKVVSGDLKQGLLSKIRDQIMKWDFSVNSKVIYVFTVRFERD